MSLLRDIQNTAIDPNADVSTLLRKCKVLSVRLSNAEFSHWVDQELSGYKDITSLPDYRIRSVQSKGHFSGPFGSGMRNAAIPLMCIDKRFRPNLEKCYFIQPISTYVDLLRSKEGSFQEPWSPDLVAHVGMNIYEDMNCMQAWKVIPRGLIIALVDAVRNRILNFVLEIESEAPDAGEAPPNKPPLSKERVTQVFNTHIYGNVGNIAKGSQHVTQTATIAISHNDLEALKKYLLSIGLPSNNIDDLESAIKEDTASGETQPRQLGAKVSAWLGSLLLGISQGIVPIIQSVDADLITQAILMYYGLK